MEEACVAIKGLNGEGPPRFNSLPVSSTESSGRPLGLMLWPMWKSFEEEIMTLRESTNRFGSFAKVSRGGKSGGVLAYFVVQLFLRHCKCPGL